MTDRRHNGMLFFAIALVVVVVVFFVVELIGGKGDRLAALGGIIGGSVGAGGAAFAVWWQMSREILAENRRIIAAKATIYRLHTPAIRRILLTLTFFMNGLEKQPAHDYPADRVKGLDFLLVVDRKSPVFDVVVRAEPEAEIYLQRIEEAIAYINSRAEVYSKYGRIPHRQMLDLVDGIVGFSHSVRTFVEAFSSSSPDGNRLVKFCSTIEASAANIPLGISTE